MFSLNNWFKFPCALLVYLSLSSGDLFIYCTSFPILFLFLRNKIPLHLVQNFLCLLNEVINYLQVTFFNPLEAKQSCGYLHKNVKVGHIGSCNYSVLLPELIQFVQGFMFLCNIHIFVIPCSQLCSSHEKRNPCSSTTPVNCRWAQRIIFHYVFLYEKYLHQYILFCEGTFEVNINMLGTF